MASENGLERLSREELIRRCELFERMQEAFSPNDEVNRKRGMLLLKGMVDIQLVLRDHRWFRLRKIRAIVRETLRPLGAKI